MVSVSLVFAGVKDTDGGVLLVVLFVIIGDIVIVVIFVNIGWFTSGGFLKMGWLGTMVSDNFCRGNGFLCMTTTRT